MRHKFLKHSSRLQKLRKDESLPPFSTPAFWRLVGMTHGLLKLQGDFVLCFSLLVDF
jgi:hypothetical protein